MSKLVENLYRAAREQEKKEYWEAFKVFSEVVGEWELQYDEDGDEIEPFGISLPVVSASPKHWEESVDFKITGINGLGFLTMEDMNANDVADESPDTVEYGHLQYVTEFMWGLVAGHLRDEIKAKLIERGGNAEVYCCVHATQWIRCYHSELEFPTSSLEIVEDSIIVHSDKDICDYDCELTKVDANDLKAILNQLQ